jgi:hypothetical protein
MDRREKRKRLRGAMFASTAFEPVLVEDPPRVGTELKDLCNAHVARDLKGI